MSADLDLAAAAARCGGRSYSWFQKHWRTLTHPRTGLPFPMPYVGALRGQRPRWLAADVEAWKAGAAAAAAPETSWDLAQRELPPQADNDPTPPPVTDRVAALIAAAGG